jgi:hypothetical protein
LQLPDQQQELRYELIQNVGNDAIRQEYGAQLDQRLHNFVSAALALVDHSRNLVRHYPTSPFEDEYEKRKTDFANAPAVAFVKDLRNYLLHANQAPFMFTLDIDFVAHIEATKTQLTCSQLLEWHNWKAQARSYINQAGPAILIADATDEYATLVQSFYEWLFPQFKLLHHEDIMALNRLMSDYNNVLAGRST